MKKISIGFNIAFLGIIIFLGCGKEVDRVAPAPAGCSGCKDYDSSFFSANTISYQTAKELAKDYRTWNLPLLSTSVRSDLRPTTEDARTVWFPLEILKAYLYSIEKNACSCKIENLGVRIYFGRYPSTIITGYGVLPGYSNRHTLFMVPTYQEAGTGLNRDFDPWLLNPVTTCKPSFDSTSKTLRILAPFGPAFNHGDLIPPGSTEPLQFYIR